VKALYPGPGPHIINHIVYCKESWAVAWEHDHKQDSSVDCNIPRIHKINEGLRIREWSNQTRGFN